MDSSLGMHGDLDTEIIRPSKPAELKSWRLPFGKGRLLYTRDIGDSKMLAHEQFVSNLFAVQRDGDGKLVNKFNLGSGLVTNVGTLALANDALWAAPSGAAVNTLKVCNWHATGTGTNAATVNDLALQTLAAPTTTSAVAGTQSLVSAASVQIYRTVATVNYSSTVAVTEWGLHSAQTLSATTGSPFTATSSTGGTATGTPFTASSTTVQGEQQLVVKAGSTAVWGLVTSNSTSALVIPAWYADANGAAGSTPGTTEAYTLIPVLWDHKVFSAINVNNGDSIQFTYSLTVANGG